MSAPDSRLVIVDYEDIASEPSSKDLSPLLELAFGGEQSSSSSSDSSAPLGLIAIRNVPGFFKAKEALLPQAHTLAHLPSSVLEEQLSDPMSFYNAGWSHGKEKLGDEPDFSKASYYFNPITDTPGTAVEREQYPASYPCNKWPTEQEIPHFKDNAKILGCIMHQVVALLAKHIDALAEKKVKGYQTDLLYNAMKDTEKAKGRLLYYFPLETKDGDEQMGEQIDNWIGWHNDSG